MKNKNSIETLIGYIECSYINVPALCVDIKKTIWMLIFNWKTQCHKLIMVQHISVCISRKCQITQEAVQHAQYFCYIHYSNFTLNLTLGHLHYVILEK